MPDAPAGSEIRAAGALPWRPSGSARLWRSPGRAREVALIHRPKYDDWSFPKGKCDSGEGNEACALREVEEETGLRCELLEEIGQTSYTDQKGRPKTVRYWRMRALAGEFESHGEVDEIRWETLEEAAELLTWSRDLPLLERL